MQSTIVENKSLISSQQILDHLRQVLADRRFVSADRMASFLRYVVERTLEEKTEEIKETVIAADVYGRGTQYDPKTDSIVRVEASRLRQKLRSYYESEGRNEPIRILLPPGSYVPRFETVTLELPALAPATEQREVTTPPPVVSSLNFKFVPVSLAAGVAACIAAIILSAALRKEAGPNVEAVAAVKESIQLLDQDPHSAQTQRGAPATLLRAVDRLEFAVAKDPAHAEAWTKLAETYDYLSAYVGRAPGEDATRAEAAARRAIALAPRSSQAHQMFGLVLTGTRWDYPAAEQSYQRALELDPSNANAAVEYAQLLRISGRFVQAASQIRTARALNPGLAQLAAAEAEVLLDLGRPEAALAAARLAVQLRHDYLRAYVTMGAAEESMGRWQSALQRYEYVLSFEPRERRALPQYGALLARRGKTEEAREVAKKLDQINSDIRNCAYQVAVVHAALGENDQAIQWLQTAWRTRQSLFPYVRVDQRFANLRHDPRFRKLVRRADDVVAGRPVT